MVCARVDEGDHLWHVVYSDADSEDLSQEKEKLTASLAWHPSLSNAEEVVMPEVDSFVWFTLSQLPCLAKVVDVDHRIGNESSLAMIFCQKSLLVMKNRR